MISGVFLSQDPIVPRRGNRRNSQSPSSRTQNTTEQQMRQRSCANSGAKSPPCPMRRTSPSPSDNCTVAPVSPRSPASNRAGSSTLPAALQRSRRVNNCSSGKKEQAARTLQEVSCALQAVQETIKSHAAACPRPQAQRRGSASPMPLSPPCLASTLPAPGHYGSSHGCPPLQSSCSQQARSPSPSGVSSLAAARTSMKQQVRAIRRAESFNLAIIEKLGGLRDTVTFSSCSTSCGTDSPRDL